MPLRKNNKIIVYYLIIFIIFIIILVFIYLFIYLFSYIYLHGWPAADRDDTKGPLGRVPGPKKASTATL